MPITASLGACGCCEGATGNDQALDDDDGATSPSEASSYSAAGTSATSNADEVWTGILDGARTIVAAAFGTDQVALVGPSAARVHGALPRPLGIATVSYPSTRPRDIETLVGTVRTYRRSIDQMDVVRLNNDLVNGFVTSVEMTMLDLGSKVPKWPIAPTDRREAIRLLAARADWDLTNEIAAQHRKRTALEAVLLMTGETA